MNIHLDNSPIKSKEDMTIVEKAKADMDYKKHMGGKVYMDARRHYEKVKRKENSFKKKRTEVLEKLDIYEFVKFARYWEGKGYFKKGFTDRFALATPETRYCALCKMAFMDKWTSQDTKFKAALWLTKHGFKPSYEPSI